MKKVVLGLAFMTASYFSIGQGVLDLAADAQCESQENILKPIIKSSEHPKRGIKATTWVRLSEAYANYTTACGRDSTSALKAWDAINKAKELDTDGKSSDEIESIMHGELMYSAIMNQGVAHYNVNNLETASKFFHIGYEVIPTDTLATFYAGIVSNQLGDTEMAKKAFKQYIEVAGGKDPASFYTLSQIAKSEDDVDTAISWLKKGVAATDDKDLRGELVNTYIQNDRLDAAISDLKALIETDPTNANTLLNLGLLYDNQGKQDLAMETYKKVLEIDPDNYDTNFSIAVLHFNEAVKIKKEVDAMDMKTYQAKGKEIEQLACSKFADAKPYFDKCLEVRPGEEEVVENLKNLNRVLGQCSN